MDYKISKDAGMSNSPVRVRFVLRTLLKYVPVLETLVRGFDVAYTGDIMVKSAADVKKVKLTLGKPQRFQDGGYVDAEFVVGSNQEVPTPAEIEDVWRRAETKLEELCAENFRYVGLIEEIAGQMINKELASIDKRLRDLLSVEVNHLRESISLSEGIVNDKIEIVMSKFTRRRRKGGKS